MADTGRGIPPESKDKLFLPYFSTKGRGTGLGLAIVHRIVTDHQGTIRVEDNVPQGTVFTMELPLGVGRYFAAAVPVWGPAGLLRAGRSLVSALRVLVRACCRQTRLGFGASHGGLPGGADGAPGAPEILRALAPAVEPLPLSFRAQRVSRSSGRGAVRHFRVSSHGAA